MFSDGVLVLFEFQIWIKCKYSIWIFYHNVVPKLGIHTISFSNNKNINNNIILYSTVILLFFIYYYFSEEEEEEEGDVSSTTTTVVFVVVVMNLFMTPSSNYQREHSIKTINRKYNRSVLSPVNVSVTKLLTWFGVGNTIFTTVV